MKSIVEPERQSIQIASLCLYYLQPSLMQKPLTCKKRWSVNWQAGPCDHGGQDFVPSLVRSKATEALGLKGVGGEPGGWTNSQETTGVAGGEMVLLRKGLLRQIMERENWPVDRKSVV